MYHNKRVITVLSFIVLAALVLAGCSGSANAQTGSSSGGFTGYGKVTQVSYTNTVESTGQIEPQHIASLSFPTTGIVAQSTVQVGQSVKAGDTLMTLNPASVPANLQTAPSDLTSAQNALNQLTNPDLSSIAAAENSLSAAYTSYQQAQAALSNAIINDQNASNADAFTSWQGSKTALDTAQNNMPLANASIDVQAYYQAVRDTNQLQGQFTSAQQNASIHPADTALADKVTNLQAAVKQSQANEADMKAGLSPDVINLVGMLSDKLTAYDTAAANFIGLVSSAPVSSNVKFSANPV